MNIKNKKIMRIIITAMLVLIFQIGELITPFTTLVKADANNYITVTVRENSYTGPVIAGATVTAPDTGDTKITGADGKCVVLDHNGNGWKSTIIASKDGYEDGQKERTVNGSVNHNTTTIVLKRKSTNTITTADSQKPSFTVTMDSYTPTNPTVGQEIIFNGTIHPQDFVIPKKSKEVVLVLDSSGSMGDSSKLTNLKAAAKKFIDRMKAVTNLKIAIVDFDTQGTINNKLIAASEVNTLNASIDALYAGGGTNTGEGLRQAAYLLSSSPEQSSTASKTIVFMSDGEPTYYNWKYIPAGWQTGNYNGKYYSYYDKKNRLLYNSDFDSDNMISKYDYSYKTGPYTGAYYGWKYQQGQNDYYTDITKSNGDSSVSIQGTGNSDTYGYCLNYAKTMGAIIKEKGYNVYSIGYGLDSSGTTKMEQIHNSMSSISSNFIQSGTSSIESIFSSIGNEIADSYPITDVNFNFNPGTNTDIVSVDGNTIKLPDFNYLKVDETSDTVKYSAEPVPFTVKIKSNITGNNIPVFTNSTVIFPWKSDTISANVPVQYINIIPVGVSQVKMEVSDSSGTINKKYDSTINEADYNVDNNGAVYKLYGQSNVAIDVTDPQATHVKYRFVKDGQQPTENDWQYMALNGDVDTSTSGYLTQMPYDVSHMPLMNNNAMWSNRNEVYKTPFTDKTGTISTNVTSAYQPYVTSENVINKDGNMVTRWVPKTLFVEDQWVEGYAPGYKEARKVWGYIKVNQTGNYYFKAYSDDGFYGAITVNGELKVLGNAFAPRGVGDAGLNVTDPIALVKDVYYPIYLEYFNWGGRAAFKIDSSLNDQSHFQTIGSTSSNITLYPSKSDSPTKNGNNVFMGAKTINFKTEPGVYTIQYALLKEKTGTTTQKEYDEITRGSFGKFEVEERFNGLSKTFSKNPIQKGEEFYINYNLTPKPIKLSDLYKGNTSTSTLNPIYVSNLILTDTLPDGLMNVEDNNSKSVNKVLDKIVYTYNSQTGNYEASPYTFSVKVKTDLNVDNISFNTSGQIDYRDVSLKDDSRISQTQYFSDIPVLNIYGNSVIIKHGVLDGNTIIDNSSNPINVINPMNYTFGFTIDVKGVVSKFTLTSIPKNLTIDSSNMCLYELDEDGKIIASSKRIINSSNITKNDNVITVSMIDNSQSMLSTGKKYSVVYSVSEVKGDVKLTAQLDSGSQKDLQLKNGNLPDLF